MPSEVKPNTFQEECEAIITMITHQEEHGTAMDRDQVIDITGRVKNLMAIHSSAVNVGVGAGAVCNDAMQKLEWARARMREFGNNVASFMEGSEFS